MQVLQSLINKIFLLILLQILLKIINAVRFNIQIIITNLNCNNGMPFTEPLLYLDIH